MPRRNGAALCHDGRGEAVNRQSCRHISAPEEADATIYSNSLNLRGASLGGVIRPVHFSQSR
jgi:hypothetical protein